MVFRNEFSFPNFNVLAFSFSKDMVMLVFGLSAEVLHLRLLLADLECPLGRSCCFFHHKLLPSGHHTQFIFTLSFQGVSTTTGTSSVTCPAPNTLTLDRLLEVFFLPLYSTNNTFMLYMRPAATNQCIGKSSRCSFIGCRCAPPAATNAQAKRKATKDTKAQPKR